MHIQIVEYGLRDINDADYRSACDGLARVLARVPGLVSMAWLADEQTNTYGGVYTWVDRDAMEAYLRSDIFNAVAADPNLVDITSRDFDALEGPSRTTYALANAPA
jgi:Putative mono-oxygenase ydhR.